MKVIPLRPDSAHATPATASATGQVGGLAVPPQLALYVHLPWCIQKCPYCDFNSHRQPADGIAQDPYIDSLIDDLEQSLPSIWGRTVHSVFLGGGTPSLFSPDSIDRLLAAVRSRVRLSADAEITLEANPGTFERARFQGFRQAGVNRLSIGVQSFDDEKLRILGRVHDAHAAHAAVETAAECFASFNLDLMFALPGQTADMLDQDLAAALAHDPPHLSCYHLTLEAGTPFAIRPPEGLPDDDLGAALGDQVESRLATAGLQRYEVSAWARAGHRCRHNLNYWEFGDYLGIGAGAHSKLSFHDRIERHTRIRHPLSYQQAVARGQAVHQRRRLSSADLPFEFMLNALRLVEGVSIDRFEARTGQNLASISASLARASSAGLLDPDPSRLKASPLGLRFLNDLQAMFLA